MFLRLLRRPRIRTAVFFGLLPAVLLAMGLRVCLHGSYAEDAGHAHAAAAHLESDLTSTADSDDGANDRHVPLGLALVKKLIAGFSLAVLPAAVLALIFLPPNRRFGVLHDTVPIPSADRRLRPPLRAPPF